MVTLHQPVEMIQRLLVGLILTTPLLFGMSKIEDDLRETVRSQAVTIDLLRSQVASTGRNLKATIDKSPAGAPAKLTIDLHDETIRRVARLEVIGAQIKEQAERREQIAGQLAKANDLSHKLLVIVAAMHLIQLALLSVIIGRRQRA